LTKDGNREKKRFIGKNSEVFNLASDRKWRADTILLKTCHQDKVSETERKKP